MTTVTTSTSVLATKGGRLTGRDSSGTDWVASYSLANTRWEFWYSTDDGATWAEDTAIRITTATVVGSLNAVSSLGGLSFVYGDGSDLKLVIRDGGSGAWSRTKTASRSGGVAPTSYTAIDSITMGYIGRIAVISADSSGQVRLGVTGNTAGTSFGIGLLTSSGITSDQFVALDFEHTGDGVTPAASTLERPFLYAAFRTTTATVFKRTTTYGASGTERTIQATAAVASDPLTAAYDGARFVMAFIDNDSDTTVKWFERDAADTATTSRTPSALSDGAITSLSMAITPVGDARLFAVGTTSDDVKLVEYDRSAGTFGSFATLATTTATAQTMTAQRGFDSGYNVVWTAGAGSPYTVTFVRSPFATNPYAPPWVSPGAGSYQDVGAALVLDWDYSNIDPADTQSAYALSRSVNGGALAYYNAGAGTWGGTETKNTTSSTAVTLATAWAADGDTVAYKVKTWGGTDLEGIYGSTLTVNASTPVTPVLTAPTDTGTITTNQVTVTWTATEQTAYRLRLLTSADVVFFDSGKVTSTLKTVVPSSILSDGLTGAKAECRVWNDDDLEGPTDTHTFTVDYVEPATATLVVAADNDAGFLSITITDPSPSGGQPTVTGHDLYVRVADGGRRVNERTVNDDGIRIVANSPDGVLYDYAAASGVDFEYRVLALADNGTSSWSAWT